MAQKPVWKAVGDDWMEANRVNEQTALTMLHPVCDELIEFGSILMTVAWHLGDADMFAMAHSIRENGAKVLEHLGSRYHVEF